MPVGVQCPTPSSLQVSFPLTGIGSGVLGFRPYWCPSPFPSPSKLGVLHSLLSAIGFQSCFFFTADVSPPIRSTLHLPYFHHNNAPTCIPRKPLKTVYCCPSCKKKGNVSFQN